MQSVQAQHYFLLNSNDLSIHGIGFCPFFHKSTNSVTFITLCLLFMVRVTWKWDIFHLKASVFTKRSRVYLTNAICGYVPGIIERCVITYVTFNLNYFEEDKFRIANECIFLCVIWNFRVLLRKDMLWVPGSIIYYY